MPTISGLLRSLGNERAVANVQTTLDARRREEWLVASLALRVERRDVELEQARRAPGSGADASAVA